MKTKKSDKANIEKKRFAWFQIGMTAALAMTLLAFEWTVWDDAPKTFDNGVTLGMLEEEIVDEYKEPLPPKPQPPQAKIDISLPPDIVPDTDPSPPLDIDKLKDKDKFKDAPEGPFTKGPDLGDEPTEPVENFFTIVEDMPHWKTTKKMEKEKLADFTYQQMMKHIRGNIKYPRMCVDAGIEGKVHVAFVIEKDGSITGVKALNSVHPALDKEAVRVISMLPDMEPGKQRMSPVRVQMNIPINFVLN